MPDLVYKQTYQETDGLGGTVGGVVSIAGEGSWRDLHGRKANLKALIVGMSLASLNREKPTWYENKEMRGKLVRIDIRTWKYDM